MRWKAIEKLCRRRKSVVLLNVLDPSGTRVEQWCGDGSFSAKIDGMPFLEEAMLPAIFGADGEDAKKWSFTTLRKERGRGGINFMDCVAGETLLARDSHEILIEGQALTMMKGQYLPIFADSAYINGLSGDYSVFFRRMDEDRLQPYIAVKNGLLIDAFIMPCLPGLLHFVAELNRIDWNKPAPGVQEKPDDSQDEDDRDARLWNIEMEDPEANAEQTLQQEDAEDSEE